MQRPSTQRFSNTVDQYIRYRPGYPQALLSFMQEELGLQPRHALADIGSGTGKLTELLLSNGNPVYAVEPNAPMRVAAETLLGHFPHFVSVDGTAERTTLPDGSIDMVLAGQAFHWFDVDAFRRESRRITRPDAVALLLWNNRVDEASPFLQAYEAFLQIYSTDYQEIDLRRMNVSHFDAYFGAGRWQNANFPNVQYFDLEGLRGRYLSCSYALPIDHPRYQESMDRLDRLFEQHQENGQVAMWYNTEVYYGPVHKYKSA